jgi:acyl dehydratase
MDTAANVACSVKWSGGSNRTTPTQFPYSPEMQIAGWRVLYFEGDAIYYRSEVPEKRGSRARPYAGLVTFETTGYIQEGRH